MEGLVIPMVQVRYTSAICYDYWTGARKAPELHLEHMEKARSKAYSGTMTSTAEKGIRKAVDLMLQANPTKIIYNTVSKTYHPFKIGFWTLTVSDKTIRPHSEVMKKCLTPFLQWMRYRKMMYIWKAELQERGQIHYHLTVNRFCEYGEIQKEWNKLQKKAGYLDYYVKQYKHYNPNSIDVHAVHNLKDIEAYLVKYIAKNDKHGRKIEGKVWGCSTTLEGQRFSTEIDNYIADSIRASDKKETDYCTIVLAPGRKLLGPTATTRYKDFTTKLKE